MTQAALILGLAIPVMGTVLGSACVFLVGDKMPARAQKAMLGFASGVMVAASVWSLLMLIDMLIPHVHAGEDKPEGVRAHLSRTTMLALAVTIHNLPEGMAVGVVLYGAMTSGMDIPVAAALAMSIGIAIQNIPEGAIVSMPMRAAGNSRKRSFAIGALSGLVEPVGALLVIMLASVMTSMLPYALAFAAGAMLYVVVEELIPEASEHPHSNLSTIGFAAGFVLMMVLDVVLG